MRLYLIVVLISAVVGAAFGMLIAMESAGTPVSVLIGAIHGVLIGGVLSAPEIFVPATKLGHAVARAPFIVTVLLKGIVYGAIIATLNRGDIGERLVGVHSSTGIQWAVALRPLVFSVAVTVVFMFIRNSGTS